MIFVNSILFLHHSFIVPAICKLEFGRFSFWIWPQNYFQFQKLKVSSLWSKEILVFFSRKGREKRDEVDVSIFVFEMDLLSLDSRFVRKMRVREVDSVMWIHERFVVLSWKFKIEEFTPRTRKSSNLWRNPTSRAFWKTRSISDRFENVD